MGCVGLLCSGQLAAKAGRGGLLGQALDVDCGVLALDDDKGDGGGGGLDGGAGEALKKKKKKMSNKDTMSNKGEAFLYDKTVT